MKNREPQYFCDCRHGEWTAPSREGQQGCDVGSPTDTALVITLFPFKKRSNFLCLNK